MDFKKYFASNFNKYFIKGSLTVRNFIDIVQLAESPISSLEVHGMDGETGSFSKTDQKILSLHKERFVKAFQKTPFDFEVVFLNKNDLDANSPKDNNNVTRWLDNFGAGIHKQALGFTGVPNKIRVIMVGNLSATNNKMPMTPWILAHKIGHAFEDKKPWGNLYLALRKTFDNIAQAEEKDDIGYNAARRITMTTKSARDDRLDGGEHYVELIAQYLIQGKVTLNITKPESEPLVDKLNEIIKTMFSQIVGKVIVEI